MIRNRIIERLQSIFEEVDLNDLKHESAKDRSQYKNSFRKNKFMKRDGRRKMVDLEKNKPTIDINL